MSWSKFINAVFGEGEQTIKVKEHEWEICSAVLLWKLDEHGNRVLHQFMRSKITDKYAYRPVPNYEDIIESEKE